MLDYDFIVEYAKSARSTCKTSKKSIEKGEIRIGQMVQAPNVDKKIPHWHHYKWFFSKGNKGLTKWEMLYGREKLRLEDQELIKKLIEDNSGETKGSKRRANKDKEKEKDDSDNEAPKKKKKKKKKPLNNVKSEKKMKLSGKLKIIYVVFGLNILKKSAN